MNRYITSALTGQPYLHDESIRILHYRQAMFYLDCGVPLLDLYPSRSYQSGEKILVFVFERKASIPIYQKWRHHQDKIECKNPLKDKEGEIRIIDMQEVIERLEHKEKPVRIGPVKDYKGGADLLAFYFPL